MTGSFSLSLSTRASPPSPHPAAIHIILMISFFSRAMIRFSRREM